MSARILGICMVAVALSGCSVFSDRWNGNDPDAVQRTTDPYHTDPKYAGQDAGTYNGRLQDPAGANRDILGALFAPKPDASSGGGGGVAVNSFLWRASLDTVSFMPVSAADPFGGTIITDWYSPPETPNERFKLNVFILGRDLRADGVRARVFRQVKDASGNWQDAPTDQATGTDIENAILTRARQIRLSAAASK
jgi:hypothetical protein